MAENETTNENKMVAARLKSAREALGFTQEEVSDVLGIPRTSVHALEAGKRGVSAIELRRLARLYRRNVDWLLGEDVEPIAADGALHRAAKDLSESDRMQVLKFAEFLAAGSRKKPSA